MDIGEEEEVIIVEPVDVPETVPERVPEEVPA